MDSLENNDGRTGPGCLEHGDGNRLADSEALRRLRRRQYAGLRSGEPAKDRRSMLESRADRAHRQGRQVFKAKCQVYWA